jgi:hypothetical protein
MSNLIFVSGLAVLLGGVIWGITSILHPNNYEPNATASRFWKPAIGGQAISYLLLVLGMVGLHVRQAEQAGMLGLIGFILALFGSALTFATNLNMAYLLPPLNAQQPTPKTVTELVGPSGPLRWLSFLTGSYLITFVPGYILMGVAVVNAGVLPALAGWLLIIGMIVSNVGAFFKPIFILRNIGGVVFGIGLAWLGLALMMG